MVADKIKELEAARAKLAALEKGIAAELNQELAALPAKYGFADAASFISAVKAATGGGGKRGRPAAAAAQPTTRRRRKRAKITDETRAQVKKMVQEEKTGKEIAAALGISLPSVQNIKTALGLVQKKKK